ncbi:unnamed protein product [Urochloa humidicola]
MLRPGFVQATTLAALVVAIALATTTPFVRAMNFTEADLASEESMWVLYERWCMHYTVVCNFSEKTQRFNVFKENACLIH